MKYIRLSDHINNIAHGNYYNERALLKGMKCPILNEEEKTILMLKTHGISTNEMFHELQKISIKLFVNKY